MRIISGELDPNLRMFRFGLEEAVNTIAMDPTTKVGPFFNATNKHASLLLKAVFDAGTHKVEIVSKTLDGNVYDTSLVIESAINFVKRAKKTGGSPVLDILLDGYSDLAACKSDIESREVNSFIKQLRNNKLTKYVSMHYVPPAVGSKYKYNFALADSNSYRFEGDKEQRDAIGYFGETDDGKNLHLRFSEIMELSNSNAITF